MISLKKYKKGAILGLILGICFIPNQAKAWCIPHLSNCMCTFVFPCPVTDVGAAVNDAQIAAQYAMKVQSAIQELKNARNIEEILSIASANIVETTVSLAANHPIPYDGNAPATQAGTNGSNEAISTTPYEGAQMALEATYSSGIGDNNQMAHDRQNARMAFIRKNSIEAMARALQYRENLKNYQQQTQKLEESLSEAQTIDADYKVNSSIKIQQEDLDRDVAEARQIIIALRTGTAIMTNSERPGNMTAAGPVTNGKIPNVPSGNGDSYPTMSPNNASAPYDPAIKSYAAKYADPEGMIRWQINKESSFNPNAQSKISTAHGLAQIVKGTAANPGYGIPPVNSSDPDASINFCTQYDSILFRKYQSWAKVLHAYGTT